VGTVSAGKTLVFVEEGRVLLDGDDVTSQSFAWQGACFAGSDLDAKLDFAFDGPGRDPKKRAARFVTTTPADALDREAVFPGAGENLPMPGITVGATRFAFFVQEAHFASREGPAEAPTARIVTPRVRAGFMDASVFAPGALGAGEVAAKVALSWLEHRAFALRLLIPPRFRRLDNDPEGTEVRRRLSLAVERFRPVGVELRVEFIDDRWVLDQGELASGDGDLIDQLKSAAALWEAPAEIPQG
jgi:hypothetical protein